MVNNLRLRRTMTKTNSIQENSRHKLLSKKVDRIIDSSELVYGDVDGYEHFMVIERHMMREDINFPNKSWQQKYEPLP